MITERSDSSEVKPLHWLTGAQRPVSAANIALKIENKTNGAECAMLTDSVKSNDSVCVK